MLPSFLHTPLAVLLFAQAIAIALVAGRRLWLSRSGNSLLYAMACAFAASGAAAAAGTWLLDAPFDTAAVVFTLGCLPLWLAVRELAARPGSYGTDDPDPIFNAPRRRPRDLPGDLGAFN